MAARPDERIFWSCTLSPPLPLRSKTAGCLVALHRVAACIDGEMRYVYLFVAAGVRLLITTGS
jgi:hypothetical protein